MNHAFTFVDLLAVAIVSVSTILAIWRGFIWETLSIFAWAAAAFASLYFGSSVAHYLSPMVSPWWLAIIAGYALVFLLVLIPISFASYRLSEGVKDSPIGALDRLLGAAFGGARGFAVVGGLYLLFSMFVPIQEHPKALRDARLLPLIQSSADILTLLIPERFQRHGNAQDAKIAPHSTAAGAPTHIHAVKAYGAADRRALDRLFEATDSGGSVKP